MSRRDDEDISVTIRDSKGDLVRTPLRTNSRQVADEEVARWEGRHKRLGLGPVTVERSDKGRG